MTVVGKILVFLNLLFSVATVALIGLVFTTRASWKTEYEKVKNIALVAEAAYKSEKIAHDNDIKSRDSQIKSLADDKVALTNERNTVLAENQRLSSENTKERREKDEARANHSALASEVTSLKTERDAITKDIVALRGEVLRIQKDLNDQKLVAVNNRIEADSQRARAERLLTRLEEVEKSLTVATNKLNALGATGGSAGERSLLNPPPTPAPRDVKGTVTAVNTFGQMVVNLGSDSGISTGNKLFVFRIDPKDPLKSLYLGEVIISRTEPKQAVGQFFAKPFAKPDERLPKVGDTVSTSLGSR